MRWLSLENWAEPGISLDVTAFEHRMQLITFHRGVTERTLELGNQNETTTKLGYETFWQKRARQAASLSYETKCIRLLFSDSEFFQKLVPDDYPRAPGPGKVTHSLFPRCRFRIDSLTWARFPSDGYRSDHSL